MTFILNILNEMQIIFNLLVYFYDKLFLKQRSIN